MLKEITEEGIPSWLPLLECDICLQRFSASMLFAWPFCASGVEHRSLSSQEQQEIKRKLMAISERPKTDLIQEAVRLYGPTYLKVSMDEQILPDFPNPHVTFPRQTIKEFRDRYVVMVEFIENIIGKKCSLYDIQKYSRPWISAATSTPTKDFPDAG